MIRRCCAGLVLLALLLGSQVGRAAAPPAKRIAFIVDSWYQWSHADVIGTRFVQGYRRGDESYPPALAIATVYAESPRPTDQTRLLAPRYGFRVAASVADALLDPTGPPRLAVDGILIATREDLPEQGQAPSPTPRLQVIREVARILDQTRGRVPIFVDKMLAPNWGDTQAIVAEATRQGVPLMGGSVLPYIPPDRPLRRGRVEVGVVIASTPYRAFAIHAAELLQGFMEQRTTKETGVASVRDVGAAFWSLPDRDRWGGRVVDGLLAAAQTGRARAGPSNLGPETTVLLIQYVDGTRAVLAFVARMFDDKEFLLGAQYADGGTGIGGLVLRGPPFDHFGYLVHALVEFFITGRAPVPVERTVLTTGVVLAGQEARRSGSLVSWPQLAVSYSPSRRAP